jgi:tape measure domain-containing protein
MPQLEAIGISAFWDNREFIKGQGVYIEKLNQAANLTQQVSRNVTGITAAAGAAGGGRGGGLFGTIFGAIGAWKGLDFVWNRLKGIGESIYDLGAFAVKSTGEMQNLTIALEALASREIIMAGGADSVTEALTMAAPRAEQLLGSLKDISLTVPFEYQDIVKTFRMQVAFGQTSDMALKLTKALTDLAAGAGLTSEFIERIGYNFSQMALYGKVTARDVRDLAWAGVDLSAVFRTQLGKSIEQINKELEAGTMTFDDLSEAFINYADNMFGGAAKRMSRTLSGLQTSFSNLRFFTIQQVFGPSLQVITERLADMLDNAKEIVERGDLLKIGAGLKVITEMGLELAGSVGAKITGFFDRMGNKMEELGESSYGWGADLIVNYASGIINAAYTVLAEAMNAISNVISYFLEPHSPPQIAPDIVDWGVETMNMWLTGFTQADFDILNSVTGQLKKVFGLMAGAGQMSQSAAHTMFADVTQALMASLTGTGGVPGSDFFAIIANSAGEFGGILSDLVAKQFALAQATKQTADAERALEDARKREEQLTGDINKSVYEYNQMLREGASEELLNAKMAQINSTIDARDAARVEADALEDTVGTMQVQQDMIAEQLRMQEQMVDIIMEVAQARLDAAEAVRDEIAALEDLKEEEEETPTPEETEELIEKELPMPEIPEGFVSLQEKVDQLAEDIKKKISETWQYIRDEIEARTKEARERFEYEFGRLSAYAVYIWTIATTFIKQKWDDLFGGGIGINFEGFKVNVVVPFWGWFKTQWDENMGFLSQWWEDHKGSIETILGVYQRMASFLSSTFYPIIVGTITFFKNEWDTIVSHLERGYENLQKIGMGIYEYIGGYIDIIADIISGRTDEIVGHYIEMFDGAKKIIEGIGQSIIDNILFWIETYFNYFLAPFKLGWEDVEGVIEDVKNMFSRLFDEAGTKTRDFIDGSLTSLRNWTGDILDDVEELTDAFIEAFTNPMGAIWDLSEIYLRMLRDWLWKIRDWVSVVLDWFEAWSASMSSGGWLSNAITWFIDNIIAPFLTNLGIILDYLISIGLVNPPPVGSGLQSGGTVGGASSPRSLGSPATTKGYSTLSAGAVVNINFGNVTINNGTDLETLQNQILFTVKKALA